ncbi:hypothetical protein [Kitasatospora sp. NPDC094016]|uniref:NUDIX hydrolase n=1 Tax=Kitasatospora sp. NPDC094016 TaxID=3154986 RepID=UPI00332E98EC
MNHPGGIIPAPLRIAVERKFGPVLRIEERPGGHTPGISAALTLAHRRVFLKAIAVCHPLSKDHQLEAGINSVPPAGLGPRPLWSGTVDGWLILVFEYVDGRHPDLSPRSPDIPMVLAALRETLEECGLTATITGYLGSVDYTNRKGQRGRQYAFTATAPIILSEHDDFVWARPNALPDVSDAVRGLIALAERH